MNNNNTTTPPVQIERAIFPIQGNEKAIEKLLDEGHKIVTYVKEGLAIITGTDSELRHAKKHIQNCCRG